MEMRDKQPVSHGKQSVFHGKQPIVHGKQTVFHGKPIIDTVYSKKQLEMIYSKMKNRLFAAGMPDVNNLFWLVVYPAY